MADRHARVSYDSFVAGDNGNQGTVYAAISHERTELALTDDFLSLIQSSWVKLLASTRTSGGWADDRRSAAIFVSDQQNEGQSVFGCDLGKSSYEACADDANLLVLSIALALGDKGIKAAAEQLDRDTKIPQS